MSRFDYPLLIVAVALVSSAILGFAATATFRWIVRIVPAAPRSRYRIGSAILMTIPILGLIAAYVAHRSMFAGTVAMEALGRIDGGGSTRHWSLAALGFAVIWAIGVAIGAGRMFAEARAIRRLVAGTVPSTVAPRAAVALREAAAIGTPFVTGAIRPTVVMPSWLIRSDAFGPILAHEISHVAHRDVLTGWIHRTTRVLLWHVPAIDSLIAAIHLAREERCDDDAVRSGVDPVALARALIQVGERRLEAIVPAAVGTTGELTGRVRRLLDERQDEGAVAGARIGSRLAFAGTMLIAGAVMLGHSAGPTIRRSLPILTIPARDPAGGFSIRQLGGRIVEATFPDGPVAVDQSGRTARILDSRGELLLTLEARVGGFAWVPRGESGTGSVR